MREQIKSLKDHADFSSYVIDVLFPVNLKASKKIAPDVGVSSPFMQRKSVLFPEPDGPMITTTSFFLDLQADVF